jgi:5-methylcytosine-specific restriction enzyme A
MRLDEIVPDLSSIMGVKAVFGVLASRIMCFGSRGDRTTAPNQHYQAARSTAERALHQRWMISIGGGADAPPELRGRVLNLTSVSSTYGETAAFIRDPDELTRLMQWPTAVALRDVYDVEGYPHVVHDLGLPDLRILENAFDQVVRPDARTDQLWNALRSRSIRLRDLPPLIGFHDQDKLVIVGVRLPGHVSADEGRRLKKEATVLERDPRLARLAKDANRPDHGGWVRCVGCKFTDENPRLFDAHHLVPLAVGSRQTVVSDFAVVCPTCHRVCHQLGASDAHPLPIPDLQNWWQDRSTGAPGAVDHR